MNTGLRQVLRYAGVPVDAAEPVRRQFGSRLIFNRDGCSSSAVDC